MKSAIFTATPSGCMTSRRDKHGTRCPGARCRGRSCADRDFHTRSSGLVQREQRLSVVPCIVEPVLQRSSAQDCIGKVLSLELVRIDQRKALSFRVRLMQEDLIVRMVVMVMQQIRGRLTSEAGTGK